MKEAEILVKTFRKSKNENFKSKQKVKKIEIYKQQRMFFIMNVVRQ